MVGRVLVCGLARAGGSAGVCLVGGIATFSIDQVITTDCQVHALGADLGRELALSVCGARRFAVDTLHPVAFHVYPCRAFGPIYRSHDLALACDSEVEGLGLPAQRGYCSGLAVLEGG